jgi:hypothetical protein
MHVQPHRYRTARRHEVRHRPAAALSVALSVSLFALLGALPTASASTGSPAPSITLPATVSALPPGEVEKLLSGVSLSDLNTTQLTEALSKLPGLSTLPAGKLKEALTKLIEGLTSKGATLGKLLEPSEIVPTLETELKKLLSLPELLSLLGPNPTTKLTEALGSLNPSQLLNTLLGSSAKPEQLLTQLLAALNPELLKTLLGTTLTGAPFSKTTVGELAHELGMTTTTLTKELNTTIAQLPEAATALTAPLTNGKTLSVLNGLNELTIGLLGPGSKETSKEGGKESTNNKESTKESGGAGSSGGPGITTIVNVPLAQSAPNQSPTANRSSTKKAGKIKIISHRVRGKVLTLVVQVPAAGSITLGGNGIRPVHRETARAKRITLRTVLTKAGAALLRKYHHRLQVKLRTSFKAADGSSSSTAVTVTFA